MKAFPEYVSFDESFWAYVKYISEGLGYTDRSTGQVKAYSREEVLGFLKEENIKIDTTYLDAIVSYSKKRADALNYNVKNLLMDAPEAEGLFLRVSEELSFLDLKCKRPMNKQSGAMKRPNYFTCLVNMLAEKALLDNGLNSEGLGFDDDPRRLCFVVDSNGKLLGTSSRRFDGAFPTTANPAIVWEIKEYYYTTTFGSRISDGVFETQLDGQEFKELFNRTGIKVIHVFFIDSYNTWWNMGKSYLCRIVDALNDGLCDEVIFGKEIISRWPELLNECLELYLS